VGDHGGSILNDERARDPFAVLPGVSSGRLLRSVFRTRFATQALLVGLTARIAWTIPLIHVLPRTAQSRVAAALRPHSDREPRVPPDPGIEAFRQPFKRA